MEASGVKTLTREALARVDRWRKKTTSNTDWRHPWDPEAKVANMKDGRRHLGKHDHILKRLLVHAGGFNLGLLTRQLFGVGKPLRQQGAPAAGFAAMVCLDHVNCDLWAVHLRQLRPVPASACATASR